MACKLKCPNCHAVCKEKDDHAKQSRGFYEVVNNWSESILKCSECKAERAASLWLFE